jgi:hypothetical protein
MENGNQAPAPADAGAPAAQPAAPAPAPAVPAQPAAPAQPANQPTPEEAEAGDWDNAVDEIFPGLRSPNKEAKKNEPADPNATTETTQAPAQGQDGNEPPKPDDKGAEAGEEQDGEENEPDFSSRDSRAAQREIAAQREAMSADVRKQVFDSVPKTLVDADGDPIRGIEDVMKLVNPRTGETFTEEEAGMWFLAAQQDFNKNMADLDKRVEQIAEVNLDLKDDADTINYKYGELLKVLPDPENPKKLYRDTLWAEYQDTLVRDPNSNVIVQTPMPLRTFYERALAPYARQAAEANQTPAAPAAPAQPAEPAQPAQPATPPGPTRQQQRSDRSEIFGGQDPNAGQDPEDAEWGSAISTVFPNLNKK